MGDNDGGTISNCYNTGSVTSSHSYSDAGGIVGYNSSSGSISNCYNTGSVTASSSTGGIAGSNSGTISNCYNTGSVTASTSSYSYPYAGGIAGYNYGSISNCYNTGSVTSSSSHYVSYAGGIVGDNDGTISECYNTGNVTSSSSSSYSNAGGIAGYNSSSGTISNCYNTGSVTASTAPYSYAGGIVGDNSGTISNCYNTGSVTAPSRAGGIAGDNSGSISECYNTGSVVASFSDSNAGGIAGYNSGTISECYYLDSVSKGVGSGTDTAAKCTIDEMKRQGTFAGFDFGEVWELTAGNSYPFPTLQALPHTDEKEENTEEFLGGTGTPYNPYLISTRDHLNNVRNHLGAHFKMVADIKFTEVDFAKGGAFYNGGEGWQPIGTDRYTAFYGVFDGDGHTITGLYVNSSNTYAGLFGYNAGIIKNLGILEGAVSSSHSYSYAGGIAGYNYGSISSCYNTGSVVASSSSSYAGGIAGYNSGTISNCYNTGSVTSDASSAGGIAGSNSGTISECYNTGSVVASSSYSNAGGIAGYNSSSGTISNCYNTGSVTASTAPYSYAGGIVGDNSGTISNCYNTGSVTAPSRAGGIVGDNSSSGTISECYNTGSVTASSYAGGIAGYNGGGTISSCYYLDNISEGVGYGTDTAVRCTDDEMKQQSTFAGFDFDTVWGLDPYRDSPYPQLLNNWQGQTVKNIELLTAPEHSQVSQGLMPDLTGATVKITYGDGFEIITDVTDAMLSELDIYKVGIQRVHLTYCGQITDEVITIEVTARAIESVAVTELPAKTTYVQGQSINPEGGALTIYYDNGTSETVPLSEAELSYSLDQIGTVSATAKYQGFTAAFTITVTEKQIDSIALGEPTKLSYIEGQALDLTGGKLQIIYVSEDNYTEEIPLDSSMITGFDPYVIGIQNVAVNYESKSVTFVVRVVAKSLANIKITKKPDKLTYLEGDEFDVEGMVVTAYYNNDTSEIVSGYEISGYDSLPGIKTITVTYNGKTATFEVTVQAKSLESIKVTTPPDKTEYLEGKDELDVTGGKLTLNYNNGTSEELELTAEMVSDFDNTKAGEQVITVNYGGLSDTFNVTIDHDWEMEFTVDKEPTCTEPGSKSHHCAYCDAIGDSTEIPAMGHSFTQYTYNNDATCTENETETAKCDRCDATDTREVKNSALGHSYSEEWTVDKEPTCTAPGNKSHHCTRCDAKSDITEIPASGHSFGEWMVEKPASMTEDGSEYRECSICHEREERVLPAGEYLPGDINGDEKITLDDVEYMLNYVYFPELYPIRQECDYNKDGRITLDDVSYLLNHIYFPDLYPLH